ncbi:MAG TPA: isoleucine--tRNA ligase [Nitrososphaeraceae archaeon]|nr:isoleucine--tRNA ligase [Nitrososphaeraceae archaeon]
MVLDAHFNAKLIERKIRDHMELIQFNKFIKSEIENRDNQKVLGYVDGPPTMNGEPHVGHLRGRIIKDLWFRFNVLKQNKVVFRPGWDTQGLPVELQVEKELGLTGNKSDNIDRVGIEKIVQSCKSLVKKYNEKWVHVDKLLGMSFDYERGYWTYYDQYMEREWSYLKKAWDNGILQEGFRVVAFCPSCQTSLSNSEVNQGYDTVEDPSFYYKVKLVEDDSYLIVWTTMPFTLITDELTAVNPDANYVYVKVNNEVWIIGETRLDDLMKELQIDKYETIKISQGKNLDGKYYIHPLLDLIPGLKDLSNSRSIHFVVSEDFVDVTTGSGIVHLSPANGEDDFNIAKKRNVPIFVPIDDRVFFTEAAGEFKDLFVRDADQKIIDIMNELGAAVKIGRIKHQYPTCWRSHHKLVWLARREYFYMIDKLGDKPLEAATNVEYFFDAPKNRFLEIIKEKVPWCISRERIWGTPLPIWTCENCGAKELLSTKKELVDRSQNLLFMDNENIIIKFKKQNKEEDINTANSRDLSVIDKYYFELHRPWIDRVEINCLKCNSRMVREPFVLDTWHNSGSAPFASFSDTEYNNLIPAVFLTEGIDQTRGWSYSLLMQNVILNNASRAPFQSFLFQGHILDEKGNKMSKSAGNVIEADFLLDQNPVDLIRFYFIWKSSPIEALNFSLKEMASRPYQVLSTLYYLHVYLKQNSILDNFDRKKHNLEWTLQNNLLELPEKWLFSVLQKLILYVNNSFENCRFHEGTKAIEEFIINDISQTYIPLTRNYIWNDSIEEINRRLAIFATLDYVLEKVDVILHPVSPFLTEYLYLNCFTNIQKASILLCKWPEPLNDLINKVLENTFEKIKEIISISNSARMKAKLKRRWPLSNIVICQFHEKNDSTNERITLEQEFSKSEISEILKSQLNVETFKIIEISANNEIEKILGLLEAGIPIIPSVSLIKKNIAPQVKSDIGKVIAKFEKLDKIEILKSLQDSESFKIIYDDLSLSSIEIFSQDLETSFTLKDGYVNAEKENLMIFLSSFRDPVLLVKGLLRDLARNLQQLRKEKSYNPTEILSTAYVAKLDKDEISSLSRFKDELTYLVRVKSLILSEQQLDKIEYKNIDIDGKEVSISVI